MPQGSYPKIDRVMSNAAIGYMNASPYIGNLVIPRVAAPMSDEEVLGHQVKYVEFDRREFFGNADDSNPDKLVRAPGASTRQASVHDLTNATVSIEELAEKDVLPKEARGYAGLSMRAAKVKKLSELVMVAEERQAATLLFTNTNYDSNLRATLTSGSRLDDDGVEPVDVIQEARFAIRKQTGRKGNVLVMGSKVARLAISGFKGNLRAGGTPFAGTFSMQQVAALLGVDAIVVGEAVYNSASAGQSISMGDIWTETTMVLLAAPQEVVNRIRSGQGQRALSLGNEQLYTPHLAYRFVPNNRPAMEVDSWYDNDIKSDWIRVCSYSKIKQTSTLTGYHWTTAVN